MKRTWIKCNEGNPIKTQNPIDRTVMCIWLDDTSWLAELKHKKEGDTYIGYFESKEQPVMYSDI
jgi:hypothetical protein